MSDLATLTTRLHRHRRHLDRQVGAAQAIARHGNAVQAEVLDLTTRVDAYTRAAAVLTRIGEERQEQAHRTIENLITRGLRTIFDDTLSFHLVPVVRGNRPEIDFVVRSDLDGTTVDTPVMDARGGGLAAIVGFLLRLVVELLSPRRDAPILLDETFAHVSAEYEPRLAEFLRDLVDRTGIQIIMVTHSDAYADTADTRYRFRLTRGVTHVEAL